MSLKTITASQLLALRSNNCWSGGREHGAMWSEMRGHRPQGMGGMGHGQDGGE